jgi:septal ring factor EnvC (AmiA/AmiB activator)
MTAGRIILLILCLFATNSLWAQKTKAQLQKEKQRSLEKIKETEKILSETSAKKKNTLGEVTALQQRIEEQQNLINGIKAEINLLNNEIGENNDIIRALEEDLNKLKKEYAALLYTAQKANNNATQLAFLFSAKSFDQLVMRLRYMEQYSETRKLQAEQITKVHVKEIEKRRQEKNLLLSEEVSENENLAKLRTKQNSIIAALAKEEKKLKADIENTKKAVAQLDKLIEDIVREEIARANKAAKSSNTENLALSSSFELNKNKFPWPVSSGFVSQKFGKQNHPVLKGIVIDNKGVNIQTKEDEKVKSIFEGEVSRVAFIQTMGNTVIIKHGEYLTVYAGLKEVFVRTGQKITTNQEIGKVQSHDGVSELRFQIFKNMTPLDPETWLRNM